MPGFAATSVSTLTLDRERRILTRRRVWHIPGRARCRGLRAVPAPPPRRVPRPRHRRRLRGAGAPRQPRVPGLRPDRPRRPRRRRGRHAGPEALPRGPAGVGGRCPSRVRATCGRSSSVAPSPGDGIHPAQAREAGEVCIARVELGPVLDGEGRQVSVGHQVRSGSQRTEELADEVEVPIPRMDEHGGRGAPASSGSRRTPGPRTAGPRRCGRIRAEAQEREQDGRRECDGLIGREYPGEP